MKILAFFLGLFLLLAFLNTSTAVEDTEIMSYASGVLAGSEPGAHAIIDNENNRLIISREANAYEIDDLESAAYSAYSFAKAGNIIAQQFSGRFGDVMGLVMVGAKPLASCHITYL